MHVQVSRAIRPLLEGLLDDAHPCAWCWISRPSKGRLETAGFASSGERPTAGIPTTYGAEPYRNRIPDRDAPVVTRLHEAGAVLVAKLSLGALALNDIWFGGQTMNPWLLEEGASGSSAGWSSSSRRVRPVSSETTSSAGCESPVQSARERSAT